MEYHTGRTFSDVLSLIKNYIHKQEDIDFILRAFEFASKHHFNQFRKSGEPYINHCIEVAYILASYQMSPTTIAAGLLHDVIEDCDVSYDQLKELFGSDVADIVEAVTKIHRLPTVNLEESTAATHRKLILAMAKDVRAVIVKLADRLHNMRTLQYLSVEKQKSISKETLEVYAPLSHRLGMNELKNELENLSFYYLDRDKYLEIQKLIQDKLASNENGVDKIIKDVSKLLEDHQIPHKIFGRIKHIYSVYKKIYVKNVIFERIFDLQAIRIITDTKLQCYEILGIIHEKYTPIPGRFKDYIAMPKPNLYQSLHTTICDSEGNLFEIQIRTKEMDRIAENGVAAHWIYKESTPNKDVSKKQKLTREQFAWLGQLINMYEENPNTSDSEYISQVQKDIFEANVYCLTPKGKIVDLPQGSTPIDFAYRIHTEVGNKTIGALVNKVIVPLNTILKTGDVVEIKTSKNNLGPREDWLKFVKTSSARSQIKKAIAKREQQEKNDINEVFYKKGMQLLEDVIESRGISKEEIMDSLNQVSVLNYFNAKSAEEIIINVGRRSLSAQLVVTQCTNLRPNLVVQINQMIKKSHSHADLKNNRNDIKIKGIDGLKVEPASCCKPIPGDLIVGYITRGSGVKVHRINCPNIIHEKKRLIETSWAETLTLTYYPVDLEILANDRGNLVVDLMSLISSVKIRIESISAKSHYETKTATISCTVYVSDVHHLETLISNLNKITGILEVNRVFH